MNQQLPISKRLQRIASYLPKKARFADIGSDHAYLPCFVCLQDNKAKAIAGEVAKGPYSSAMATVTAQQLDDVIDVRLGDGLSVLKPNEVEQLVIAGMGGSLIKTILSNGIEKLGQVERIIVQPNVDARTVRKWLNDQKFGIVEEEIIQENGHCYEIIVADKLEEKETLTEKEFLFGPVLLASEKTSDFYEKWRSEEVKLERVLAQLKQASIPQTEKLKRFSEERTWIREELQDEQNHH